jgi:hypothetical protein
VSMKPSGILCDVRFPAWPGDIAVSLCQKQWIGLLEVSSVFKGMPFPWLGWFQRPWNVPTASDNCICQVWFRLA